MNITPDEVYVMKRALESRREWIEDDGDGTEDIVLNNSEIKELKYIVSILDKLNSLNYWLEIKEGKA